MTIISNVLLSLVLSSLMFSNDNAFSSDKTSVGPFVVALTSPVNTLEPANITDANEAIVTSQIFDNIFEYSMNNGLQPGLARSFSLSPDGLKMKVTLRPSVKFSDGAVMTAQDVADSLTYSIFTLGASARWAFGDLKGFEEFVLSHKKTGLLGINVLNSTEIEFLFKRPFSQFAKVLAAPYFAISKNKGNQFLGTGPYILEHKTKNDVTLIRNLYSEKKEQILEKVRFQVIPSQEEINKKIASHEVDLASYHATLRKDPPGMTFIPYKSMSTALLVMNVKSREFSSAETRCSFASSFVEASAKNGYMVKPLQDSLAYSWSVLKLTQPASSIGRVANLTPIAVYYSTNFAGITGDKSVDLKKDLARRGFDVSFVDSKSKNFYKSLVDGKFVAALAGFSPDYLDPDAYLTPMLGTGQQFNWSSFSNLTIDKLLSLSRQVQDKQARRLIYDEVFTLLGQTCPVQFLGSTEAGILLNSQWSLEGVNGFGFHSIRLAQLKSKEK